MDGVKPLKKPKISDREREFGTENVKLKQLLAEKAEELDIEKNAATYFAKNLK